MPSSTAAAWPSPGRFALALIFGFALTLTAAWLWGVALIEAILPTTRVILGWIDDRFGIVALGVEHNWQDTVVRLRVTPKEMFVMGGLIINADNTHWLEVTTTSGAMLQSLVIAPAIAVALPGSVLTRIAAFALAALLAFGFMLLDLPLTLFAFTWDMLIDGLEPDRFSPLMMWHEFLHAGGRLGMGVLMGLLAWRMERGLNERFLLHGLSVGKT